jgi:PAS domain S-box-containing protein
MPSTFGPLAAALAIDAAEIQRRLDAADLGQERLAELARHRAPLQQAFAHALDAFYPLLATQPELAALVQGPGQVERLRRSNERYLHGLLTPSFDDDYIESRLQVGATHHRLHVRPQAYLCAFGPLLDEPLHWLLEHGAFPAAMTLLDRALFDAGLALDAYGLRLEQDLRQPVVDAPVAAPTNRPTAASTGPMVHPGSRPMTRLAVDGVGDRRAFLALDQERLALLRTLEPVIAGALPAVLDDFYRFFTTHPQTARLVPAHAVPQLQQQVAAYWREFATGAFDRPYAASRMRVGMMHERIGLSPQWYLSGLARQVRGLLAAVVAARPDDASRCVRAFVRALLFDVSFVLDAYMDCRAETVLRTEGYSARLIASLTAGVAVLDAEHRIRSVNRSMLQLLGVDAALLPHMPITAALPLAELPPLLQRLAADPHSRPSTFGRRGGRALRLCAVHLDDGNGGDIALVVDDVTDLQRVGAALDRESQETDALVDAVPDMLWAIELPSWTVLSMSRQALALTGRRELSFVGRSDLLLACIAPADRERFQRAIEGIGDRTVDLEHRLLHQDGGELWCHTRARAMAGRGDRTVVVGTTRDITAVRGERERRLQSIGQLAGGVAHELNNALTVVFGEIELLELAAGAHSSREGRDRALSACRRMTQLTGQLLAFAQRQLLQPRDHDLAALLREWQPQLRALLGPRVTVDWLVPDVDTTVRIDRNQLLVSLCQLFRNADDAMPDGGSLVLRLLPGDAAQAEIELVDSGHGMAPHVLARACEPFFSTRTGAAGLGLSTVLGFVNQSGGELSLDSTPGSGTRVRLRLPRALPSAPRPQRSGDRRQPTLLVVEDDVDVRRVVTRVAAMVGFRTVAASSGEQALAMLDQERVDAAFSDIMLGPGLDGVALAERIRARLPQLPIVLTSGYSAAHFQSRAERIRHHFLAKPFTVDQLHQTLSSLLSTVVE